MLFLKPDDLMKATSKDGKEAGIELIQPPPGSKPGDRVYFEGEKYESALIHVHVDDLAPHHMRLR